MKKCGVGTMVWDCLGLVLGQSFYVKTSSSHVTFASKVAEYDQHKLNRCRVGSTTLDLYSLNLVGDLLDEARAGSSPARSTHWIARLSRLKSCVTRWLAITNLGRSICSRGAVGFVH
jgi:hypothetical protein